jgi:CheY-like chemotaxis protein
MSNSETVTTTSVLIVDDNPKNLQVLGGLLQKEGINVEFALDGVNALGWLEKKNFDLILLDIMMPVMDGFEVCSRIKENPSVSDIPIIFITAKTDSESIVKGFELGGVDYITKPFITSELLARVNSHVQIKKSKDKIELQRRNINDSIKYARNIQKAVLNTSLSKIGSYPENFILYLPKDIVSGDFYWYYKEDNFFVLAVMDCTGHGVPGAFMSILGTTLLNEIVLHDGIVRPDEILEYLRSSLIDTLGQKQDMIHIKDGMEGAVITYNFGTAELNYSGAFSPLYHIHNHKINKLNGDRTSIGYFEKVIKFSMKTINIEKGDIIYLSSDGYIDQFGGNGGKKLMSCGFVPLLEKIHNFPMEKQKSELLDFCDLWKGDLEQTDDILVVGVRF